MNIDFSKLIKTHGLAIVLLIGGLYIRDKDLREIKEHNALMEKMLFDCYEDRLKVTVTSAKNFPVNNFPSEEPTQIFALIDQPNKRKRYDNSLI